LAVLDEFLLTSVPDWEKLDAICQILKSVFLCGFYGKSRTKTPEKQVFKFKIKIKKVTDLMYKFWMICLQGT
jgi:hypothetical protein